MSNFQLAAAAGQPQGQAQIIQGQAKLPRMRVLILTFMAGYLLRGGVHDLLEQVSKTKTTSKENKDAMLQFQQQQPSSSFINPNPIIDTPDHTDDRLVVRILPHTGDSPLRADWILDIKTSVNTDGGSMWLPRPPSNPLDEYDYKPNSSGFVQPASIRLFMFDGYNTGDFIAYFLAPIISSRLAEREKPMAGTNHSVAVVGSILGNGPRYSWGAGFIQSQDVLHPRVERIFAIRGPVSYAQVQQQQQQLAQTTMDQNQNQNQDQEMHMDKVFGDAGSLMPWFYQPHNRTKVNTLCVMPHYVDAQHPFISLITNTTTNAFPGARMANIMGEPFSLFDTMVQCDFIVSTTLHGIIFADAYGIPNAHMKLSNKITGGFHKYDDYFESVHRNRTTFVPDMALPEAELMQQVQDLRSLTMAKYQHQPPSLNLLPYWNNCPFHAEGYHRTRQQHLQFAKVYAEGFAESLKSRPRVFSKFVGQVEQHVKKSGYSTVDGLIVPDATI